MSLSSNPSFTDLGKKKLIEAEPVGKHHPSQWRDFQALPFAPSITIRATGASVSTKLACAATRTGIRFEGNFSTLHVEKHGNDSSVFNN